MSSALRTFSQIEPSVKFLRSLPSSDPSTNVMYVTDANMEAFITSATAANVIGSGLNTIVKSATAPAFSSESQVTLTLVRDMGRKVTIVSLDTTTPKNAVRQVWIQVQRVDGTATEGVPGNYDTTGSFWIRTFRDVDGVTPNIEWARLG